MSLPQPIEEVEPTEVDPKYLVAWLVIQHTCEWCDGDIEVFLDEDTAITPRREWRCREVKKNGYVSKHWKHWLLCRRCAAPRDFARWVFPIIKNVMPEHEALSAIMEVQPMSQPNAEVFYMDIVGDRRLDHDVLDGPRGQREHGVMIDDVGPVNPGGEVWLLPEPHQPNRNGRVYAKGAVTYKKWQLG